MYYETVIKTGTKQYRLPNTEVEPLEYDPSENITIPVIVRRGGEEVKVMVTSVDIDVDAETNFVDGFTDGHIIRGKTYTIELASSEEQPDEITNK